MSDSLEAKKISDSLTEVTHILFPRSLNDMGRLYGGQLLEWLDELAGIVARRHCGGSVVTASIDRLDFKEGARQGDMVYIRGYLTYAGTTSMEVRMDSYVENISDGSRHMINTAFFVMVAVDEEGSPTKVPPLIIEGVSEQAEWEAAKRRMELRKVRRKEGF
ncbi:MAG: acyl-CoA thioesterase [Lachnospiraceae bacterium]|nr:acyl-CoA thioesterase [Lachnospiraceae bacterium]